MAGIGRRPTKLAGILALTCWTTNAFAADGPALCANPEFVTSDIDKDAFAEEALIQAGVSAVVRIRLDAWRKANPKTPELAGLTSREAIALYGSQICDMMGCAEGEANSVTKASFIFLQMLKDTSHFSFRGWREGPATFLRDSGASVRCFPAATLAQAVVPPPTEGSGKPPLSAWGLNERVADRPPTGSIRIRGKGDDLIYAQYDPGYTDASKANISFEWDDTRSKGSLNLVGAVGYSVLFPGTFNEARTRRTSWGFIPYVGVDIESTKEQGKDRKYDSNSLDFGATFQLVTDSYSFRYKRAASQYLSITPHFLVNRADDSRLLALNLLYRPTISFSRDLALNGFSDLKLGSIPLKWEPIIDGRIAYGHFTTIGTRTGDDANDSTRIGFRYGIALASRVDRFPVDLVVSDTPMFAVSGAAHHISLFESTLSLYFDADKHFGTDLKYTRGRASDLDERVAKWTVGLSVRY